MTRFPHGVLEVKLSLPEGQKAPEWVQDLLDSGYLTEVSQLEQAYTWGQGVAVFMWQKRLAEPEGWILQHRMYT